MICRNPWRSQVELDLQTFRKAGLSSQDLARTIRSVQEKKRNSFLFHIRDNEFYVSNIFGSTDYVNKTASILQKGSLPGTLPMFWRASLCFRLPDLDGVIAHSDAPTSMLGEAPFPIFSWNKDYSRSYDILVPWIQFLWSWKRKLSLHKIPKWNEKKSKAVFRGSTTGGIYTLDNYKSLPRSMIVDFCQNNTNICDAKFTKIVQATKTASAGILHDFGLGEALDLYQEAHYKYIILPDGNGAPASRSAKYFFTKSVILKHETEYQEFFYGNLRPFVHYVPLSSTLADLEQKLDWLTNNDAAAERIAENAFQYAMKYFDDYHISCYMADLSVSFRSLFGDEPLLNVSNAAKLRVQTSSLSYELHQRDESFSNCPANAKSLNNETRKFNSLPNTWKNRQEIFKRHSDMRERGGFEK